MNIDYEKIQHAMDEYGWYILTCIKNQYYFSLTREQRSNIDSLLQTPFIVVEKLSPDDVEFFSKQAGIADPENYSANYIPPAHGGRTKGDNKIHIYPYTKSFSDCKTEEDIIQSCIDNVVVHEIFHYFIRPDVSYEGDTVKEEFGHFLTEGLVQYYAQEFAQKYRLGNPKSNYGKNVVFAKQLIASLPDHFTQSQIDKTIFTCNQDELLAIAKDGESMYQEYVDEFELKEKLASFLTVMGMDMGMEKNDETLKNIIRHYTKMDDKNVIFDDLSKKIESIFKDNIEVRNRYLFQLQNLIYNKNIIDDRFSLEHKEEKGKSL